MENTFDKITEFFGSNLALAPDADAAGLAYHLAHHVLRLRGGRVRMLLALPTDGPLRDVVWPHVRRHAGWGLTKTEIDRAQSRDYTAETKIYVETKISV